MNNRGRPKGRGRGKNAAWMHDLEYQALRAAAKAAKRTNCAQIKWMLQQTGLWPDNVPFK